MIKTSVSRSLARGRPIYTNPESSTSKDAIANLKAFTLEKEDFPYPPHWQPFGLETNINSRFRWMEMDGATIRKALHDPASESRGDPDRLPALTRARVSLKENVLYFAIVDSFVPKRELHESAVKCQLDCFYRMGFMTLPYREKNWCEQGVLVDFSDIVSLHGREWHEVYYRRMDITSYFERSRRRYVGDKSNLHNLHIC